ncbi:MAG: glycogen synthase [Spirochaetia bacterium]
MSKPVSVWHVAREYAGVAEAGGVKDVVRGLAEAQARAGAHTSVVIPQYGFLPDEFKRGEPIATFTLAMPDQDRASAFFEETIRIVGARLEGVRLLFVQAARFADKRNVYVYTAEDEADNHLRKKGTGHWDFHQMNLVLQKAALETAIALGELPQVFHCHDGHTAFLPALMREDPRYAERLAGAGALLTIHNAGQGYHQEVWDKGFARLLTGLPDKVLQKGMIKNTVDPILLAGSYAPLVTVSEQYALELLDERDQEMSGGLGRALREKGIPLDGITNGVDPGPWDPRHPEKTGLRYRFDPLNGDLEGKKACRKELAAAAGMGALSQSARGPLYAFVGRLTGQKGIDVLFHAIQQLLSGGSDRWFVVLGEGEKEKEAMLTWLAADGSSHGRLVFIKRYDPRLATLIYAASDFLLVPSTYEPCGLTDFIAQLMGSIPIVHRVGGLVKVRDGETGFSYDEQSGTALAAAVDRSTELFLENPQLLEQIRRTAFGEIFSAHTWDRVLARGYGPLYEKAAEIAWTRR